jgi:hypothetical protein
VTHHLLTVGDNVYGEGIEKLETDWEERFAVVEEEPEGIIEPQEIPEHMEEYHDLPVAAAIAGFSLIIIIAGAAVLAVIAGILIFFAAMNKK